ncbi:MAG: co-chaperone DjlA [Geopsychrobacter sp.]|nr:co-chaperone DjlA [Geopsychrobacter sp.]
MSWLSGVIGGGIGAMIAGPFGAVIGAAIGANMGGKSAHQGSHIGFSEPQRKQALFFTAAFSMVGKLAKADGRVCEDEIAAIHRISQEALGLDAQTRAFAINVFNQAKESNESFASYAQQFGELFRQEAQLCNFMMNFLFEVAMADGELHPAEEAMLQQAKQAFNIHDSVYQSLHARHTGSNAVSSVGLEKHYALLGISQGASKAEIKKAYRKKVSEFHPDKIEGKGLPPEFIKFANDKVAEINASYDAVMPKQ